MPRRKYRTPFPLVDALDVADREATDAHRMFAADIRDEVSEVVLITARGDTPLARETRRALMQEVV